MLDQNTLFEHLLKKSQLSGERDFIKVIAKCLSLSVSGAYKKVKGISKLSFDEASIIASDFNLNLSLVQVTDESDHFIYPFISDDLAQPPNTYEGWVKNTYEHSLVLDKLRPDYTIINYQRELTYFHLLGFKSLFYFKLYVWNKTNWNIPELVYFDARRFRDNHELNQTIKQLQAHYNTYQGIDIWYQDLLTPLLKQIAYYRSLGAFKYDEDFEQVIKELHKLISHLEKTCQSGRKYQFGLPEPREHIDVYLNQTHNSGNLIFF